MCLCIILIYIHHNAPLSSLMFYNGIYPLFPNQIAQRFVTYWPVKKKKVFYHLGLLIFIFIYKNKRPILFFLLWCYCYYYYDYYYFGCSVGPLISYFSNKCIVPVLLWLHPTRTSSWWMFQISITS